MSESERRHIRYVLAPGEFTRQRLRGCGILASLRGWKDCWVKDMSSAGALLLTKTEHYLGDTIDIELTPTDGKALVFRGEVVNLGKDHATSQNKMGIKLEQPAGSSPESKFLDQLQARSSRA